MGAQRRRGHSEEAARRVCGTIEAETNNMGKDSGVVELLSGLLKLVKGAVTADPKPKPDPKVAPTDDIPFTLAKFDDDEQLVFGWANVSMRVDGELVVDRQGDIIEPEVLEKAAYNFMLDFRESGVNHEGPSIGQVVESVVFTPDKLEAMGVAKDALPLGWWIGVKLEDQAVFKAVKAGKLPMFSIQGSGEREPADVAA